jgi:hypothetical protein
MTGEMWEPAAGCSGKAQRYSLEARFDAEGRVTHDRLAKKWQRGGVQRRWRVGVSDDQNMWPATRTGIGGEMRTPWAADSEISGTQHFLERGILSSDGKAP